MYNSTNNNDLALYIHYPFCESKCPYCDFNSHVSNDINYQSFIDAYLKEIAYFKEVLGQRKVTTIFFGGGTPSLMPLNMIEEILAAISKNFTVAENVEISLEANPSSFETQKFKAIKNLGVNRLSVGIQSFTEKNLKFLGRKHNATEAINAVKSASEIFDNFSFDLMYCLPGQKIDDWLKELEYALSFNTKHLSVYQLTIEKGTNFYQSFMKKEFVMPDEDLSYEFFTKTHEFMTKNGFNNYEISNFAKPDFECQHNLNYWQGVDYLGIGAGAHSRLYLKDESLKSAIVNFHAPEKWKNSIHEKNEAIQNIEKVANPALLEEILLTGLRLEKGLEEKTLMRIFDKKIAEIFDTEKLKKLEKQNLIIVSDTAIKINPKQKAIANLIIFKVCEAISKNPFKINSPFYT